MRQERHFRATVLLTLLILAGCTTAAWAHQAVAVIPLMSAAKPLQNIVTVAKSGGDFTDPAAAVASITDASETNPYLVYIAPGTYTLSQTVVMKPYVDLRGSGQNVTVLTGSISGDPLSSGLIKLASYSWVASLSVLNKGGGASSVGIVASDIPFIPDVEATLDQVRVRGIGGTDTNYGVYFSNAKVTILDSDISAEGGVFAYGVLVLNNSAAPNSVTMKDTVITAKDGTNNIAMRIDNANMYLESVWASSTGGTNHIGLAVAGSELNVYEYVITLKDTLVSAGDGTGDGQNFAFQFAGTLEVLLEGVNAEARPAATKSEGIEMSLAAAYSMLVIDSEILGGSYSLNARSGTSVMVIESLLKGAVSLLVPSSFNSSVLQGLVASAANASFTHVEMKDVDLSGTAQGTFKWCSVETLDTHAITAAVKMNHSVLNGAILLDIGPGGVASECLSTYLGTALLNEDCTTP